MSLKTTACVFGLLLLNACSASTLNAPSHEPALPNGNGPSAYVPGHAGAASSERAAARTPVEHVSAHSAIDRASSRERAFGGTCRRCSY